VSLRARILVVLFVVSAAVAMSVDSVTYFSLRSFLVRRVDQQLDVAHRPVIRDLTPRFGRGGPGRFEDLGDFAPGLYVELRANDGEILVRRALVRPDQQPESVELPTRLPVPNAAATGERDDVAVKQSVSVSGGARYRVAIWRLTPEGDNLVLALPLNDVDSILRRLLYVELLITGLALAAGLVLARSLVQVGLRPLDDIAATAGAIAGGDLTQRVPEGEGTEVGRLGGALNKMLGQIEKAFAERRASEDRLRRFVADASHELRTPLTSIRAYAELFDRGADRNPEDLGRLLHGIENEAVRMGILVDDLLLLARLDQGRPLERVPVDLGALASEAVDAARAIDPARPLELHVEGSVEVQGDRVRLRQVIDNLLANVRAHTPDGTAADVSVRADGDLGILVVSDEGPGLSPEQQAQAFERFYRADPSRSRDAGGAGLGLAIVAAIAAAHDGRAGVNARAGGGVQFVVHLPLLDGHSSFTRPDSATASS
jgi:two-component system OmpR family sensor kinase